ncbi:MAG: hypothetical protein HRU38_21370 [Saccharospirillaceae bacterium]|nr:hypothetical protein [Pseudomonadales bacterium]NRB81180.1 hypothetical protein [Saccharospirillaceae bacterium]
MAKFKNQEEMILALEAAFIASRRFVNVYVRRIDPVIWSDQRVISAIKKFLRAFKHAQLEIIQFDSQLTRSCDFFNLAHRLSQIKIYQVNEDINRIEPEQNYLYGDTKVVLIQTHYQEYIGFFSDADKARNQSIQDIYKHIKIMAKPSNEFKTLMV